MNKYKKIVIVLWSFHKQSINQKIVIFCVKIVTSFRSKFINMAYTINAFNIIPLDESISY